MAYQAIPRNSPDWTPDTADQLNVIIDRVEKKINEYPNVTREHWYNDTRYVSVSITGEGCSIRENSSMHYGQIYFLNFSCWITEGFSGRLGDAAISSSPSPVWLAGRSDTGLKVPVYIEQGEVWIPLKYRGKPGVVSVYGVIVAA